jgi:hypothetical protein
MTVSAALGAEEKVTYSSQKVRKAAALRLLTESE